MWSFLICGHYCPFDHKIKRLHFSQSNDRPCLLSVYTDRLILDKSLIDLGQAFHHLIDLGQAFRHLTDLGQAFHNLIESNVLNLFYH